MIKLVNDFLGLVYRCGGTEFPKDIIVDQLSIFTPVIEEPHSIKYIIERYLKTHANSPKDLK